MAGSFSVTVCASMISLVCWLLPLSTANLNDFHLLSWNTQGSKWDPVWDMMHHSYRDKKFKADVVPDVFTAQGGADADFSWKSTHEVPVIYVGADGKEKKSSGVKQRSWNPMFKKDSLNVYYVEVTLPGFFSRKEILAIFTKKKVDKVVLLDAAERLSIKDVPNSPVLGVVFNNTYIFTMKARPAESCNEAPDMVHGVLLYMAENHSTSSWFILGDFQREPRRLPFVPMYSVGGRRTVWQQVVFPGQPTVGNRTQEYAVVGAPAYGQRVAVELLRDYDPSVGKHKHQPLAVNYGHH